MQSFNYLFAKSVAFICACMASIAARDKCEISHFIRSAISILSQIFVHYYNRNRLPQSQFYNPALRLLQHHSDAQYNGPLLLRWVDSILFSKRRSDCWHPHCCLACIGLSNNSAIGYIPQSLILYVRWGNNLNNIPHNPSVSVALLVKLPSVGSLKGIIFSPYLQITRVRTVVLHRRNHSYLYCLEEASSIAYNNLGTS